jgi:hypothetical protein
MDAATKDLTSDFTSVDTAEAAYVHDGSRYWLQNDDDEWINMIESSFKRHLVGLGKATKAEATQTLSEIDALLVDVEMNFRVKWAAPLAGHWAGFKRMGGHKVLITEDPHLVEPIEPPVDAPCLAEADCFGDSRGWPVIGEFIRNLLSCPKEGNRQVYVWFSYIKHTLDCLYGKYWDKSPTLALAGEINCGKSLITELTRELFAKKIAQPYDWMVGRDNFNGDMLEAVLLSIDDEVSDTNPKSRAQLGDRLKKMCANPFQRIRGIQKEGIALQPLWRPMICVNDTPDKLMVLPQIEEDNHDKIILLKAYAKPMPMPSDTTEDKRIFWATIMAELPHFVWWLLKEFKIPKEYQGRFGVKYYHHPDVIKSLSELSSEMQFWYFLEKTLFEGGAISRRHPITGDDMPAREWMGRVGDLYGFLTDTKDEQRPCLSLVEAQSVPKPGWIGQRLTRLSKLYPECVQQVRTSTARYWHIKPPKTNEEGVGDDSHDSF